MQGFDIRDGVSGDFALIDRLYPAAFPNEDLRPLVKALLHTTPGVLSLVSTSASGLIGHVAFTPCSVPDASDAVALLGPLAVAPAWQRQGVGSALVQAGFNRLRSAGFATVFVLGDPAFYGRFGFAPERSVAPPFALPKAWRDAWQSIALQGTVPELSGTLSVPPAWHRRALWAP
jgi:putative acetyltransferase